MQMRNENSLLMTKEDLLASIDDLMNMAFTHNTKTRNSIPGATKESPGITVSNHIIHIISEWSKTNGHNHRSSDPLNKADYIRILKAAAQYLCEPLIDTLLSSYQAAPKNHFPCGILHIVAQNGDSQPNHKEEYERCVMKLIDAGVDPNETDFGGRTPLITAAVKLIESKNVTEIANLKRFITVLFENKANPTIYDKGDKSFINLIENSAYKTYFKAMIDSYLKQNPNAEKISRSHVKTHYIYSSDSTIFAGVTGSAGVVSKDEKSCRQCKI